MERARQARRRILGLGLPLAAAIGGCAAPGGAGPRHEPEPAPEAARIAFVSYNAYQRANQEPVSSAVVRVRALDGSRIREYRVKAGDRLGTLEADGDYRTGLTVARIGLGDRAVQRTVDTSSGGKREMTLVIPSRYLALRDAAGREQIVWIADGRRPNPDGSRDAAGR
jgi:hypothetical protein